LTKTASPSLEKVECVGKNHCNSEHIACIAVFIKHCITIT